MAYRRVLSIPSTLLARRFSPIPFTYISHHDRCTKSKEMHSFGSKMETFSNQRKSLVSYAFRPTPLRRGISTSSGEATEGAASIYEVFIAASDSAFPVAAVQYLIDYVHTLTGLNWWASIAIATLLVSGAMVPLYIKVLRKNTILLAIMTIQIIMIMRQIEATVHKDPAAAEKLFMKVKYIIKKGGISPYLPLFAHGSMMISFYFAVMNMAEKVPSFKTGGTLWFTDLSTPDTLYIFPISMTLLTLVRLKTPTKFEKAVLGNQLLANNMAARALAVLWIPLTMSLPNAVFCFLITSEIFTTCFREAAKDPRVQKALGLIRLKPTPPLKSSTEKRNT